MDQKCALKNRLFLYLKAKIRTQELGYSFSIILVIKNKFGQILASAEAFKGRVPRKRLKNIV